LIRFNFFIFSLLLSFWRPQMAADAKEEVVDHVRVMYNQPPAWFVAVWIASAVCFIVVAGVTVANVRRHMRAARQAGLGFGSSMGPRADLIVFTLWLPLVYSSTGLMQTFSPPGVAFMSFIRVCYMAMAATRVITLLFMLAGGQQYVSSMLPKQPVRAFAKPPCCCLVCKVQLTKRYLGRRPLWWMVIGVRQFSWTAPVVGLFDILAQERFESNQPRLVPITILLTLVTLVAMYCYRCLTKLIAPLTKELTGLRKTTAMAAFLQLHFLASKLPDLIVNLIVKSDYNNTIWVLPEQDYSAMLSGAFVCALEIPIVLLGWKAFPLELYPAEPDYGGAMPLDMIATLQVCGIDTSKWEALSPFRRPVRQVTKDEIMVMEPTHPAAAVVVGKNEDSPEDEQLQYDIHVRKEECSQSVDV